LLRNSAKKGFLPTSTCHDGGNGCLVHHDGGMMWNQLSCLGCLRRGGRIWPVTTANPPTRAMDVLWDFRRDGRGWLRNERELTSPPASGAGMSRGTHGWNIAPRGSEPARRSRPGLRVDIRRGQAGTCGCNRHQRRERSVHRVRRRCPTCRVPWRDSQSGALGARGTAPFEPDGNG